MPGKRLDESKREGVRKLHEYFQKQLANGVPLLPLNAIQEMNHRSSQSVRYTQVGWVCLAIGLFLQIVSGNLVNRSPNLLNHHRITKRSFYDLQCKGVYDKAIFAKLDRICEDCYNLFREPSIYSLCRDNCFSEKYFKGCVESLLMEEDWQQLEKMVEFVGK